MGEQVSARSYGGVAQLGEHLPCKQGVMSSNLIISTSSSEGKGLRERKCTLRTEYSKITKKMRRQKEKEMRVMS